MLWYDRLSKKGIKVPNELELECEGHISNPTGLIVYYLNACKMLSKGYLYHLAKFSDLERKVPSIDSASIVNEFQDVA